MPERSESHWGETAGQWIRGWGLESPASNPSLDDPSIEPSKPTLDLSFHLGDAASIPHRDRSIVRTRTIAPSTAPKRPSIRFPNGGDEIGGFRIVAELGRGAFARVYLAEQADLAGRLVALKVAEALGDEPQALARLQHTHIVPIYSIHDDPETDLRLLCMPYVGGANLAQILEQSGARSPTQATNGRSLIEALDHVGGRPNTRVAGSRIDVSAPPERSFPGAATRGLGSPTAVRSVLGKYLARMPWLRSLTGSIEDSAPLQIIRDSDDRDQPARRFLRSHTYVQAAVWITARLAEGLDHAHSRGILHRDLKPSNILIAADGTPMLLDFNLAAETDAAQPEGGERARLGGTLPYMAPEHLDAFNPLGETSASSVDERSDIYALGLILYEMVTGRHAFDEPPPGLSVLEIVTLMTAERSHGAKPARSVNSSIPRSLDAIISKSLAPDPKRRYARAADFAEDLQRFLDDRPNAHAPEPSLVERSRKWFRRHPEIKGAGPIAAMATIILLIIGSAAWSISNYAEGAQARLRRNTFRDDFMRCQLLLNTASGTSSHRERGIAKAESLMTLYEIEGKKPWLKSPMVLRLPDADRQSLREEMAELMLLTARARVVRVGRNTPEPLRRKALESAVALLTTAEATDPRPSSALYETRARFYKALGESEGAEKDRKLAENTPPSTARDYYLRGTAHAANGERDAAESDLNRAVALDPKRFWAWFVLGLCYYDDGRYSEAQGAFSVCTSLAPDFPWPHLNRGLALARAGQPAAARDAYDRALTLAPDFIEALVDRSLVCLQLNDPAQAERDLGRAIHLGRRDAGILAAKAEAQSRLGHPELAEREFAEALAIRPDDPHVLVARGVSRLKSDPKGAAADFGKVLSRNSRDARAHYGMALLLRKSDPKQALDHANRALDADPGAFDALRLRAVLLGREGNPAAVVDAHRLEQRPSAQNLYNAACALALLDAMSKSIANRALARDYLGRALKLGFPRAQADADPDLASIRD